MVETTIKSTINGYAKPAKVSVTFQIEEDLDGEIRQKCGETGQSRSGFTRSALKYYLKNGFTSN